MRYDTLYPEIPDARGPAAQPQPVGPGGAVPPLGDYTVNLPVIVRRRKWRWVPRILAGLILLFLAAVAWLVWTAPLSKSLEPPVPPSITLLSAEGTAIARTGAVVGKPVDAAQLPEHVVQAFVAVEDRRFQSHWGVDPRGILRAFVNNMFTDNGRQGGSTITQQLAKNAFLNSDRTFGRKFQEVLIAFWLEAWLTKNEILSRYLSNVYFGDNQYGLDAAARHYFSRPATDLTTAQAAMLAGLVKAPSRLAPSLKTLPSGTYFADWVLPEARDRSGEITTNQTVTTTLEARMQRAAERAVRNAALRKAQVAIVAMRPDGRVIAMVGGKNYAASPFNRATQAQRQPGSTFKLFVYLAALRSGMTPDSIVRDEPITLGDWSPKNSDGRYRGPITLREAFARSSNVAAARLTQRVGVSAVIQAARDLGIASPIPNEASIALGTSSVSLLELTAAYAAIASGTAPVRPRGLADTDAPGWAARLTGSVRSLSRRELDGMRDLLSATVTGGTGRSAALAIDTFGKTGTTQDNRDALFLGYADGIITGVWMGNDDNSPNGGLAGGGAPARVWRDFMSQALGVTARPRPEPVVENVTDVLVEDPDNFIEDGIELEGSFGGRELGVRVNRDGSIEMTRPRREGPPEDEFVEEPRDRGRRDERRREQVPEDEF
ncbi:MAG: penicillin-binding protein [Sphingomonas sp. 32-66-10]|nr:MAG: penicillin-binding protein [Sphingomonas sp. 32-66-10]